MTSFIDAIEEAWCADNCWLRVSIEVCVISIFGTVLCIGRRGAGVAGLVWVAGLVGVWGVVGVTWLGGVVGVGGVAGAGVVGVCSSIVEEGGSTGGVGGSIGGGGGVVVGGVIGDWLEDCCSW